MGSSPRASTRPGIYRRWPPVERQFKRYREIAAIHAEDVSATLKHYAETGAKMQQNAPETDIPAWCALRSTVLLRGTMIVQQGQIHSFKESRIANDLGSGLRYAWFAILADLFLHEGFPRRFPGRSLQMMSLGTVQWAALGFTLGCRSLAEPLILSLIDALKRDFFFDRNHYPIFYFILRLFADWHGVELGRLPGAAFREAILNALLERWRTPDPIDVAPSVLAACDFHTHRCRTNTAKEFFEFDDGLFTHFPVEILMLYRLRDYEGLKNPEIDHPLMKSSLGRLPSPMPCDVDELLGRFLERARAQGFDEDAIVRSLLSQ